MAAVTVGGAMAVVKVAAETEAETEAEARVEARAVAARAVERAVAAREVARAAARAVAEMGLGTLSQSISLAQVQSMSRRGNRPNWSGSSCPSSGPAYSSY